MIEGGEKVCQITGILPGGIAPGIMEALNRIGIINLHISAARTIMLQDRKGIFGLASTTTIVEDPADILTFLIGSEHEDEVLDLIIEEGELTLPGRGTVFSEDVNLFKAHEICRQNTVKSSGREVKKKPLMHSGLMGISCIAQRGEGNHIARVALDTGTCVPVITFGHGTGLRDKLGLLRIAIPAEKEVITVIASSQDADTVMNMMIDAGRLDQPGKGFIYVYPIRKGIVNTKITRGMPKHAASMEQMIAAVDEIRGNTTWRRRTGGDAHDTQKKRKFLSDLIDYTFICNEGRGEDLVKIAMSVGAAGATISKLKHRCPEDSDYNKISRAREGCYMIISEGQVKTITDAIGKEGAFDDKTYGQILIRPAPKACTYLGG